MTPSRTLFLFLLTLVTFALQPLPTAYAEDEELDRVVAVVNDDVITATELQGRITDVMRQLAANDTPLPPKGVLVRQMLERMVLERLQLQKAEEAGVRVDDESVNQTIEGIAARNNLSLAQFQEILASDSIDFAEFREGIRTEMIIARLRQKQINSRITISPQEVSSYLASQGAQEELDTEYHLQHILVEIPEAATSQQVQEARAEAEGLLADLKAGADFRQLAVTHSDGPEALEGGDLEWRKGSELPSAFAEAVVKLAPGQVSGLVRTPGGFHILKLLEKRGEVRHVVRQTHARHILIQANAVTADMEAKDRLARLRERILAGEDFGTLARAHSDDSVSAANGGDLGWLNPGQTVPDFEKAMDETELGKISEPFRSQFGWHIVQPLERRDYDNTEEFRRTKASEALRQRKIAEETENFLRQLRDESYVELRLEG